MHSVWGSTLSSAFADGHQLHCPASPTVRCDRARQRPRSRQLLLDTSLSGPGVCYALSFGACPVTNTAWCHHFRARIDLFNRHNGISNLLEASSPRSDNTTHSLSGLPRIADHGELTWFHHFPLTLLQMSLWTDPVLTMSPLLRPSPAPHAATNSCTIEPTRPQTVSTLLDASSSGTMSLCNHFGW